MKKQDVLALVAIAVVLIAAGLVALAGNQNGETVGALPIFALCAAVAFGMQWSAFVPAFAFRTEKFFDLTGGLTYITVVVLAMVLAGNWDARSMILAAMVLIWAVRLGSFLFRRVLLSGGDR